MLQASVFSRAFRFGFKARTSRGLMKDKTSWFIKLFDSAAPEQFGIGECGPLPGLSIDHTPDFEGVLFSVIQAINEGKVTLDSIDSIVPSGYPSLTFGLETARLDFANGGRRVIFRNDFLTGKTIPINGLIWMGDMDFMMNQINQKIAQGFRCIKLKVGGLDFDRECDVLDYLRKRYFRENIEIRLDANGAFKLDDALYKLSELAKFNVHSIEQPIKPGFPEMEELCRKSPIPVAFDEELIGKQSPEKKEALLRLLKPKYIVLKPTLHGGFKGTGEWIEIASALDIGWWITSALESSIGLNAICQFTANYQISIPQGLGTGMIYENNFESPLVVEKGLIRFDEHRAWCDDFN
jgi:o-succinylbenzoate synthase